MATSRTILTKCTNGVSFGNRHVVTAGEAGAAGVFLFNFSANFQLAAAVQIVSSVGAIVAVTKVEYPAVGQVKVTATVSEGDIISVVAQRASAEIVA